MTWIYVFLGAVCAVFAVNAAGFSGSTITGPVGGSTNFTTGVANLDKEFQLELRKGKAGKDVFFQSFNKTRPQEFSDQNIVVRVDTSELQVVFNDIQKEDEDTYVIHITPKSYMSRITGHNSFMLKVEDNRGGDGSKNEIGGMAIDMFTVIACIMAARLLS